MSRITRNQMFMEIATIVAKRSTCARQSVGCIIICNNNIRSIGYNGPPRKDIHCDEYCFSDNTKGCIRSIHAEKNAIKSLGFYDDPSNIELYVTLSPCVACARLIIKSDINKIFYLNKYRDTSGIKEILKYSSKKVFRLTISGYLLRNSLNEKQELYEVLIK